ncbi:serine protease [bacterium]|nr:serine protease [bacterium]
MRTTLPVLAALAFMAADTMTIHDATRRFGEIADRTRNSLVIIQTVKDRPSPGIYADPTWQELGTGFVFDAAEGFIVTTYQTVKDAIAVSVTYHDGITDEAKVVGSDRRTDLALLRVLHPRPSIPAIPLAPPGAGRVGEPVLAMGASPSAGMTYSMGIFAANPIVGDAFSGGLSTFLQFDASLNGGMQGGPILSLRGDVLGVASFIERESREMFLNFAIPADTARIVLGEIIAKGVFEPLAWGMDPVRASEQILLGHGYDGDGPFVPGVREGSSAWAAGMMESDFIVAVDGEEIHSPREFWQVVGRWAVEDDEALALHVITVWRSGDRKDLQFVPKRGVDGGVR